MLVLAGLLFYLWRVFYKVLCRIFWEKRWQLCFSNSTQHCWLGKFSVYKLCLLIMPSTTKQVLHRVSVFIGTSDAAESFDIHRKRKPQLEECHWPNPELQLDFQSYSLKLKDPKLPQGCMARRVGIANCLLDVTFGVVLYVLINTYAPPDRFVSNFTKWRDATHIFLNELLDWLMGAPAGLKLNHELTIFLGKFFLYHIYIWIGYLLIMEPYYIYIVKTISFSSCFGLSITLSLASDTLSFLAFHTYCFYVYAAKIYKLQLQGLISLSRLFRGKKWNPLRNRVDSIPYDANQLAFGTILFTILLFLLPTTGIYYFVFTALRMPIIMIKAVVHCTVKVLNTFPFYEVMQSLFISDQPVDDITCRVLYGKQQSQGESTSSPKEGSILTALRLEDNVTVALKFNVASVQTIIKRNVDTGLKNFMPVAGFLKSLFMGNIVNSLIG